MSIIKFRGKTKDGKWKYGDLLNIDFSKNPFKMIRDSFNNRFTVDKETVGQFTGLTDNEGQDLYEGDIIQYEDENYGTQHTGVVKYLSYQDYPAFDVDDHGGEVNLLSHLIGSTGFTIIGNIHGKETVK